MIGWSAAKGARRRKRGALAIVFVWQIPTSGTPGCREDFSRASFHCCCRFISRERHARQPSFFYYVISQNDAFHAARRRPFYASR